MDVDIQIKDTFDQVSKIIYNFGFDSSRISEIKFSPTMTKSWGNTKYNPYQSKYTISLNKVLLPNKRALEQTLLHELIHTLPGCMNHGKKWKTVADYCNNVYGYNISRTNSAESLGVTTSDYKYIIRCQKCGKENGFQRMSNVVKNYRTYHCICGGRLERIK